MCCPLSLFRRWERKQHVLLCNRKSLLEWHPKDPDFCACPPPNLLCTLTGHGEEQLWLSKPRQAALSPSHYTQSAFLSQQRVLGHRRPARRRRRGTQTPPWATSADVGRGPSSGELSERLVPQGIWWEGEECTAAADWVARTGQQGTWGSIFQVEDDSRLNLEGRNSEEW